MSQLFLTSSVNKVSHKLVKHLDFSQGNKLVFIDTAAEPKEGDLEWLVNDRKALAESGFSVTDYTITGKKSEQIKNDLKDYEYIYMSGGDTYHLLTQSYKVGFIQIIRDLIINQSKIYIGTSAGSIITGPQLPLYLLDPDDQNPPPNHAYDLVNFTVVPHWGAEDFRERYLNIRLKMVYTTNQLPFILLTDTQYIHIKNGLMKIHQINQN